jgi:Fe2+ transport system protein FeoA
MLVIARRPAARQTSTSSLAAIRAGDRVRIQSILIDGARQYCEDLGFGAGDVIRCRNAGRSALLLVTPGGRTVSLDRDWARFIQVRAANTA